MPTKSNIVLGSGTFYITNPDGIEEVVPTFDIPEIDFEPTDDADVKELIKLVATKASFEAELEVNREWTLVYCRNCRQPIPIIQFDAIVHGEGSWTCPICTLIARRKMNV